MTRAFSSIPRPSTKLQEIKLELVRLQKVVRQLEAILAERQAEFGMYLGQESFQIDDSLDNLSTTSSIDECDGGTGYFSQESVETTFDEFPSYHPTNDTLDSLALPSPPNHFTDASGHRHGWNHLAQTETWSHYTILSPQLQALPPLPPSSFTSSSTSSFSPSQPRSAFTSTEIIDQFSSFVNNHPVSYHSPSLPFATCGSPSTFTTNLPPLRTESPSHGRWSEVASYEISKAL
jgi:hypothetical protein